MRKPTDICLLCRLELATKTNSHILPKFLSKKLFGPKTSKLAFNLSSNESINKPPRKVQDSPKENYILCPSCEIYFSVLESVCSETFRNWKIKTTNGQFKLNTFSDDFSLVSCISAEKIPVRLLIYSIFWRASISRDPLFNSITLSDEIEISIRSTLLSFKSVTKSNLQKLVSDNSFLEIFPFAIITADSFKSETSNILFVPYFNNSYRLIVDQFTFVLFLGADEIKNDFFERFSNRKIDECKFIIFSHKLWDLVIIKPVFNLLAEKMIQNKI